MKRYTTKELYRKLGKALKNTPFIITWHGKPKYVVIEFDTYIGIQPRIEEYNDVKEK